MSQSLPPPLYNSLALRWQKLLYGCASAGPAWSEAETWGGEESRIISGAVFPLLYQHYTTLPCAVSAVQGEVIHVVV